MISQTDFDQLVHLYPPLAQFPVDLSQALYMTGQRVRMPAGFVLFDVGYPCTSLTLLNAGTLRVTKPGQDREILLYYVRPGGFCILTVSCLLRKASYTVRGVAEEDLLGVAIPAQLFTRILKQATGFPVYLLHYFGKGLPELIDLIECVTFMRLNQRLATLLLSKGPLIETTHQKLADELGSVREVVSRILKDFEEDNILRLERGHIHILDRLTLEKIASDDGD